MFNPQEQTSSQQPVEPINKDPREQAGQQQRQAAYYDESAYEQGYVGNGPYNLSGDKLRPRQQSLQYWQVGVIAAIAFFVGLTMGGFLNILVGLLFGLLGLAVAAFFILQFGFQRAQVLPARTFTISERANLVVRNPSGTVRIRRSSSVNTVEVRATIHTNSLFSSNKVGGLAYQQQDAQTADGGQSSSWNTPPVFYQQQGDQITVTANEGQKAFWSGVTHVNLEILAPEVSDVDYNGSAGTINLDDVSGQMRLKTSAGTIHVSHSRFEGNSSLITNAGTIHMERAHLQGDTRLETNAGTIHYDGSLEPGGHYSMLTNAGTIDAILPSNSSFTLQAATDLGTVNNEFGGITVGNAPHAQLSLRTNLGTIKVSKR
jgi:hypothetical protein